MAGNNVRKTFGKGYPMAKNKTMDVKIKNGNRSRKQDASTNLDSGWDGVERMADDMKKRKLGRDSQGVRYWEDNGPTLSNTLLAALAEPKRGLMTYYGGKYAEAMRRNVQANIATAQKFVVSNSMVEHAYLASMARPKSLLEMLQRGIPPFNNMWIEWDEKFRRTIIKRELDKMGIDTNWSNISDESDRVGYHISVVNDHFMYSNYFTVLDDEKVFSAPVGFHIAHDDPYTNHDLDQDEDAFRMDQQKTSEMLIGEWYLDKYKYQAEKEIVESFISVQSASMHWMVSQEKFAQGWTHREMAEMKALSLTSQAGDGRFLIALLGLLNYDLVVHETTTPPKKIDHVRFGRVVPKNEYKVVTIQLPKPRGKRIYEQMFTGHGSPKKEHWRRGHWRTLKDKFGRIKKRVWIGEMKVGNPELGTIVHDYRLEGK